MSESVETTWEEARRCPRCKNPGVESEAEGRRLTSAPGVTRGAQIHVIYCLNEHCRWYNTSWTVQTNPDGTIPPPTTNRQKFFRPLPGVSEERINAYAEAMQRASEAPGGMEVQ